VTEQDYRDTFRLLGRPLESHDGVSEEAIAAAETKLECRVPAALRAFYRVAGNALDFTNRHDQLLAPGEWSVEGDTLVFLAENQTVVLYAIDANPSTEDPPVLMSNNEEPFAWRQVCGSCSEFLRTMMHWEGAFAGAMPLAGTAIVDESFRKILDRDYELIGEVNAMRAYSKDNIAVCFVQWGDERRIFVGATNREAPAAIQKLGVALEMND
jgi:hypothetical protein